MPALQDCVNRYVKALSIPNRLIALHPQQVGNPGNASAIAPAVVLMSISAFEGFVEDVTAAAMVEQGHSYSFIAKIVGNWTNPDVKKWRDETKKHFGVDIKPGFAVRATRGVVPSNWSASTFDYDAAEKLASAWMNVRHALTHGGATSDGAERWPTSVRQGELPSYVLKVNSNDPTKHHLQLPGARGCAAIYTYAARRGADQIAAHVGQPALNWTGVPDFDRP